MYLISIKHAVKQWIAPSWRNSWQETIIQVFAAPITVIYRELYRYFYAVPGQINHNSQVMVLESVLNRIGGYATRRITIGDGQANGTYIVYVPLGAPVDLLVAHLHAVKVAGKTWQIIEEIENTGDFDLNDFNEDFNR